MQLQVFTQHHIPDGVLIQSYTQIGLITAFYIKDGHEPNTYFEVENCIFPLEKEDSAGAGVSCACNSQYNNQDFHKLE